MECFGTTDFDNNSRLITLSAIIISGLHCTTIRISISNNMNKINIIVNYVLNFPSDYKMNYVRDIFLKLV